jgi:hypothetical protein
VKVEFKPNWSKKGCLTEPKMEFWWEIIATNLDEFQKILVWLGEALFNIVWK